MTYLFKKENNGRKDIHFWLNRQKKVEKNTLRKAFIGQFAKRMPLKVIFPTNFGNYLFSFRRKGRFDERK
jgi:hypothetical protein